MRRGQYAGAPIITLLNLDRLNNQNDPQPDGVFDYVEGYTIFPQNGKIMFPVLEPFGEALRPVFGGRSRAGETISCTPRCTIPLK